MDSSSKSEILYPLVINFTKYANQCDFQSAPNATTSSVQFEFPRSFWDVFLRNVPRCHSKKFAGRPIFFIPKSCGRNVSCSERISHFILCGLVGLVIFWGFFVLVFEAKTLMKKGSLVD